MTALHIQVFGPLQLSCQGQSVSSFPTRYVSELLSYLLLHPAQHHAREKLVAILWPDCEASKGRARLSTTLWRLRGVFDEVGQDAAHFLQCDRDWVAWLPSRPFTVDLTNFTDQMALARAARSPEARQTALAAAAAAYTGDLCAGLYADWCLIERERLARVRLAALGELMNIAINAAEYGRAIELGQTILRDDPLREEVHRALIVVYGRCHQPTTAVRQFQLCARLLQTELGILPMPETIAAYRQVLADGAVIALDSPLIENPNRHELQAAFAAFQQASLQLQQLLE